MSINVQYHGILLKLFKLTFAAVCLGCGDTHISNLSSVDVRIGTHDNKIRDRENCAIGPQLPFGAISPGPQTPEGSHDGYSPDQPIRGFGQLHVSGTGWGKYGQIFVSPQIGVNVGEASHDSPKLDEVTLPYEYGVSLTRYGIRTEFTPARHSAIYRFIFPKSDSASVLIDLSHHLTADIATMVGGEFSKGSISLDTASASIFGYGVYSGGFGDGEYAVHFVARFDRKPKSFGTWKNATIRSGRFDEQLDVSNDRIGAYFGYSTMDQDTISMKVAISMKSVNRAQEWLADEIPDFDFDEVRSGAMTAWEHELSKINIYGATTKERTIFYTALYHSMLMPRDRSSDIRDVEAGRPVWDDHYAIWDTWRTLFPLMVLINPGMVSDNITSFIGRYQRNGIVNDAFIAGNDMIAEQGGNDVDNIIVEAYLKGVKGVDWEAAYQVVKAHADGVNGRLGWQGFKGLDTNQADVYISQGWIPADTLSSSYTLEYAYNDFCAGLMAQKLGYVEDAEKYLKRSHEWVNLWDSTASSDSFYGFIVPREADGAFVEIDLKHYWGSWKQYFYEANAWTYSFFAPHDMDRLIKMCGGKVSYTRRLIHALDNDLTNPANEPGFLAAYTFIHAGRPDLASRYVREILETRYTLTGLPGNDDSGAMSSWYVFSSLGLFPNAGQDYYYLIGSRFEKSVIELHGGKKLVIESVNASERNVFVQSCTLNGRPLDRAWIRHEEISNGGVIRFVMGDEPSTWGTERTGIRTR